MTEEILREIVSALGRVDREKIDATTPLTGSLGGSLGRARLDAALRAKSFAFNPAIYRVATYGELCDSLGFGSLFTAGNPISPKSAVRLHAIPPSAGGMHIGVDMESLSNLPEVTDYWEDPFYKRTFTHREVAYALLQASPRASFGAMWCAKEALRKAHSALIELDWQRLEVMHDANGKPSLAVDGEAIEGALSLSHTDELAFAAFVSAQREQAPSLNSPVLPLAAVQSHANKNKMPEMIAAFALLVSILTLVLTLWRH